MIVLVALSLLGPTRINAWAWPYGQQPKLPRKVFHSGLIVAAIVAAVLTVAGIGIQGYGLLGGDVNSRILPWHYMVQQGIETVLMGALVTLLFVFEIIAYGAMIIYLLLVGVISRGEQGHEARLADCGMRRVARGGKGTLRRSGLARQRMASFEGDPNEYFVSPGLYRELSRNIGERYSYTVTTSLFGCQYIRRRPQRLS